MPVRSTGSGHIECPAHFRSPLPLSFLCTLPSEPDDGRADYCLVLHNPADINSSRFSLIIKLCHRNSRLSRDTVGIRFDGKDRQAGLSGHRNHDLQQELALPGPDAALTPVALHGLSDIGEAEAVGALVPLGSLQRGRSLRQGIVLHAHH